MVCRSQRRRWKRHSAITILTTTVVLAGYLLDGSTQPPGPPGDPGASATSLPPYRAPVLSLVQPPAGGRVPQDRPIVVFRFAPGESGDPIDARSFSVTVGGENRSGLFQVAASEAWGPLAPAVTGHAAAIAPGAHAVAARICSVRGACAEVSAMVTVVASPASIVEKVSVDGKRTLLDLILLAARTLLDQSVSISEQNHLRHY